MSDDPLADSVGALMKEDEEGLDPRLERLARGQLSDEELRELQEAAKSDPKLADALALHQPLSPEFRAKLARELKPSAKVIPFRRIVAIASIAAAAAVGVLWLQVDREPLPQYALVAKAGDAEWRGEAATKREARADSMIEIVLTPDRPVEGEIAAKLFVLEQGALQQIAVRAQVSQDGAVRWIDRAHAIAGGRTGSVTVVAKVGRTGAPDSAWQSMTLEVEIRAAGGTP